MIYKNKRTEGKIKTHYGMKDYYYYFKETNSNIKINTKDYSKIISRFNEGLVNIIIEDNLEYVLPYLGASICIKKDKRIPKIIDGKLINTTPVDWVETNKLWAEDEEAKEKKLLVRYSNSHTSKYVFRIYFKKYIYPFMNKRLYNFKSCRSFNRLLGKRIKDETKDKYDTFLLY
jgi:hypothetical protein